MSKISNTLEKYLLLSIRGGLAHSFDTISSEWTKPYPEVTGYLLSYFCNNHKYISNELINAGNKLVSLQHISGGFPSFYQTSNLYTFDTAQIMHGLLMLYLKTKNSQYLGSAMKSGEFLLRAQLKNGAMFPIYLTHNRAFSADTPISNGSNWGSTLSYIQVKNCEGLLLLSKITGERKYRQSAEKLSLWGEHKYDHRYTHPFAYYLEGQLAMEKIEHVKTLLKKHIIARIQKNGFISYEASLPYAYVSGSAQLAILLKKTGYNSEANEITNWLFRVYKNLPQKGMIQYANKDGTGNHTLHAETNTWGTKYFLQLLTQT